MKTFLSIMALMLCVTLNAQNFATLEFEDDEEMVEEEFSLSALEAEMMLLSKEARKNKLLKRADKAFEQMWYAEAATIYEEALKLHEETPSVQHLQKIADSYYFTGELKKASKWYEVLFENYQDILSKDDLFKYSHVLKGLGRKETADRILGIIADTDFEDGTKAPSFLRYKEQVVLENLNINTKYSEFSPTIKMDGKVVFASASDSGFLKTRRYKWNNQPFLDLYEGSIEKGGHQFMNIKKLSKNINTKHHEASATFSPDGKTLYFTRNNNKKKQRNKKNVNHLKIFVSKQIGDDWSDPKEVPFNNEEYSTGHPAMSPDGKKLYFVSDIPGGYGDTDLYVVDVDENGKFSEPQNLGAEVNSPNKEMFPFPTEDKIYFSSNRRSGLGGLDIYQSNMVDGKYESPKNMGKPFNSIRDDFSFMLMDDNDQGYLASNRKGGKGDDDIYFFRNAKTENVIENRNVVSGLVVDAINNEPVANAIISLYDADNVKIVDVETGDDGTFKLENLISNHDYTLNVNKEGYDEMVEALKTEDNVEIKLSQKLMPSDAGAASLAEGSISPVANGTAKFETEAVYFNFDSFQIREDAKLELDELASYLIANRGVKLQIESHTDSRGAAAYNKYLSEKRAEASMDYLLEQGVDAEQIISAIGYGEDLLLNDCTDGYSCSRAEHQLNRRSEFILVYE